MKKREISELDVFFVKLALNNQFYIWTDVDPEKRLFKVNFGKRQQLMRLLTMYKKIKKREDKKLKEIYKRDVCNGMTSLPFEEWLIDFQVNGNCDAHSTNPDF